MRYLIVEDDVALSTFLGHALSSEGHQVVLAHDGAEAVAIFREEMPDLTILDLNLPIMDGEQVLRQIRAIDADLPVLILSARHEVETRIRCLDNGADDFLLKPFSLQELRARGRALMRRKRDARLTLRAGAIEINRLEHTASCSGRPLDLTNKEFALLEHLMLHHGHCVSRVELLDSVWKMDPAQTTNIVDVYVNYLRRKLHDPPPGTLIRTRRGEGYYVPSESQITAAASGIVPQSLAESPQDSIPQPA